MPTAIPIAELEDFALELATTAGAIARSHFRKPLTIDNKQATVLDPVTTADRAIERVLRDALVARYTDLGIVAVARGSRPAGPAPTRFGDSIDGTTPCRNVP